MEHFGPATQQHGIKGKIDDSLSVDLLAEFLHFLIERFFGGGISKIMATINRAVFGKLSRTSTYGEVPIPKRNCWMVWANKADLPSDASDLQTIEHDVKAIIHQQHRIRAAPAFVVS